MQTGVCSHLWLGPRRMCRGRAAAACLPAETRHPASKRPPFSELPRTPGTCEDTSCLMRCRPGRPGRPGVASSSSLKQIRRLVAVCWSESGPRGLRCKVFAVLCRDGGFF
eukprot:380896-Rhodomonas_salina.3